MNELIASSGYELGIAQAVVTTIATALTVGVAYLVRPGLPTLAWSIAFTLAMLATFGVVAGEAGDLEILRRASLGALLGAPVFLWSGFRAEWGLPPRLWAGAVFAATCSAALALTVDIAWFTVAYRTAFFAASVFALLFVVDWMRAPERRADRLLLPLVILSVAFGATGLATFVAGVFFPPSGGDDFALVRVVSSIGMLAYVACALVAVLATATRQSAFSRPSTTTGSASWQRFERTASDRLARAQQSSDAWSIVYLSLDDAADIRQTAGATAFGNLSTRFEDEVRAAFPAEADVGSPSPGTVVVLVPRPDALVRDLLRSVLERVTHLDVDGALPIRPTASAGWSPVSVLGYDLDALVYTAREAGTLASEQGGDRWERVSAALVERVISRSERR